jgi:hypothetical protein
MEVGEGRKGGDVRGCVGFVPPSGLITIRRGRAGSVHMRDERCGIQVQAGSNDKTS